MKKYQEIADKYYPRNGNLIIFVVNLNRFKKKPD